MTAPRRLPRRLACAFATALILAGGALSGCGETAPPQVKELLVVDGITIELAELEPFLKFLDSYLPEGGRKAKVRRILEEHVLPMHLARRAHPAERRAQLQLASDLCSVATNIAELEKQTTNFPGKSRRFVTRSQAKLPVAMFLFDELLQGAVSPPLEVPFGYIVASCYEVKTGALTVDDHADSLQVGFATHPGAEWQAWLVAEQKRIADKVTFVHPDYREAMPPWLVLPKLP